MFTNTTERSLLCESRHKDDVRQVSRASLPSPPTNSTPEANRDTRLHTVYPFTAVLIPLSSSEVSPLD